MASGGKSVLIFYTDIEMYNANKICNPPSDSLIILFHRRCSLASDAQYEYLLQ